MENYININDPDYEIELFWYSFKESMNNFYNSINKDNRYTISEWSTNLNLLKKNQKYNDIENNIKNYIAIYALDLIKYSELFYHDSIFVANIRRWNKISDKYKFNTNSNTDNDKKINFFIIFFTMKQHGISNKDIDNLKNLNKIFVDEIYDDFILYSLEHNKPKILELLKEINSKKLENDFKRLCPNIKFNINSKMTKTCQLYQKYNNTNI